jgi:hypothetical protein
MKQLFLLALPLLFASTVFSQQKFEFGFAVKAGTFTLPQQGEGTNITGSTRSKNSLYAGFSTGFGAYGKFNVASCWGISGELLYYTSTFELRENFDYDPYLEQFMLWDNVWTRRYVEQSLVLPVKIHLNLGASAKTTLSFGIAPAFNLKTDQRVSSKLSAEERKASTIVFFDLFYVGEQEKPSPRTQWLFTAGFHRHISEHTSIGIELLASPCPNELDVYFTNYKDKITYERSPFVMKSLAISLHHNILR